MRDLSLFLLGTLWCCFNFPIIYYNFVQYSYKFYWVNLNFAQNISNMDLLWSDGCEGDHVLLIKWQIPFSCIHCFGVDFLFLYGDVFPLFWLDLGVVDVFWRCVPFHATECLYGNLELSILTFSLFLRWIFKKTFVFFFVTKPFSRIKFWSSD